jgi:hypothetical protein
MVRCFLGVLVVAVGLVALASTNRRNSTPPEETAAPSGGPRLRETEAFDLSGWRRTLLRPLPALDISFSLN